MDKKKLIRIVRDDGKEFKIGDDQEWLLLKNGLEGFGAFENDLNYVDNATADGGVITSQRLGSKDRTISCAYVNFDYNDVARKSALEFFNAKNIYKVYLTYAGVTRWAEGRLYKFSMPNTHLRERQDLSVTFLFQNPYLKSYDDFGKDIASITAKTGFPYMCSVTSNTVQGVTGGVFNFARKVVLDNDGDVDTFCRAIFTATGDVVNPKLIINDDYVRVIDTLHENDVIAMDFTASPPTVKKNGVNYIGHCDRTSAFDSMILGLGDTEVQYNADDGSNNLMVSIYYNKLYCAI